MLDSLWLSVLISGLTGFLSGLGAGGGGLLMLWMTVVVGMPPNQARIINIMYFIPCALVAGLFRLKQGQLPLRKLLPAILAGCVCAYPAVLLSYRIHVNVIKKLFGLFLVFTGSRELFTKSKAGQ